MAKDNSTGKTKGFYDRGKAIFDRIPGMPKEKAPRPVDAIEDDLNNVRFKSNYRYDIKKEK